MKTSNILLFILLITLPLRVFSGEKAPNFTLKDLDGKKVSLYDMLKTGPVLVDFWATWCKSCLQELPILDKFNETYRSQGLQIVAISIDSPKSMSKVKPYVKSSDFNFKVLIDSDMEVRKLFGGTTTPYSVLISQTGEITYSHLGYVPGDEVQLEQKIKELLSTSQSENSPN